MALRMDRLGVHRTMITAQSTGEMRFLERIKISPEPRFTFARRVTLERLADIKTQADPAARLADHIDDGPSGRCAASRREICHVCQGGAGATGPQSPAPAAAAWPRLRGAGTASRQDMFRDLIE